MTLHSETLGAHSLNLNIHTDSSTLLWLQEFFQPVLTEPQASRTVELHLGTGELHSPAGLALKRDGLTFDSRFSENDTWEQADGTLWAQDESFQVQYSRGPEQRYFEALASPEETRARLCFLRLFRELVTDAWLREGYLPLHGSCFELEGRSVMVCGPRRAGKSSLLLHALHAGAQFVSNDRVFLKAGQSPRAMPTVINLRDGSLELFPQLREVLDRVRFDRLLSLDDCSPGKERPDPIPPPGRSRVGLSHPQLVRALELCGVTPKAQHSGEKSKIFLFPQVDLKERGLKFSPLSTRETQQRLEQLGLFRTGSKLLGSDIFRVDATRFRAQSVTESCEGIAREVPGFQCLIGLGAFDSELSLGTQLQQTT